MPTNASLLWIPALPLIGAAINLLFGRFLSRRAAASGRRSS